MAKKKKTRVVAKPKRFEIDGHRLTEDQYDRYTEELVYRRERYGSSDEQRHRKVALSNVLLAARASSHVKERVHPLFDRILRTSTAIGALYDFPFLSKDQKLVELGNAVIGHCADELDAVAAELRGMHAGITQELASGVNHG